MTIALIKGVCVGVFLASIGVSIKEPRWILAMLSLSIAFSL